MQIKETIERQCCQSKDLKPYLGQSLDDQVRRTFKPQFCVYCGQIWGHTREHNGIDYDTVLEKWPLAEFPFTK